MTKNVDKETILKMITSTAFSVLFLIAMYFAFGFKVGQHNSIAAMLLTATIITITAVSINLFFLQKIKLHALACFLLLSFGVFLVFTQPIINTPDENAHLARAELTSRLVLFVNPSDTQHQTIESIGEIIEGRQQNYWTSNVYNKPMNKNPIMVDHVAASNNFYTYIPQALGIGIAKLFNLNSIWLLWLARLFNLFAYTAIVTLAIKVTPLFKQAMFFIALLPMNLQQGASASPDSLINSLSILFIAFVLFFICNKNIKINYKHILLLFSLSLAISLPKVTTNLLLVFLVIFIPKDKFESPVKAILAKLTIITPTVLIAAIYYIYTFSFAPVSQQLDYLQTMNVNSSEQIKYILQNPLHFFTHFIKSLTQNLYTYVDMLNLFGWIDYGSSLLSIVMVFWLGKLCFEKKQSPFNNYQKLALAFLIGLYYFITVFAMYLGWSSVGASIVSGVQGRYLIPVLMLLPLLFSKKGNETETDSLSESFGTIILSTNMIAFMLIMLVTRYY